MIRLAAVIWMVWASGAAAQACLPHQAVSMRLMVKFGEQHQFDLVSPAHNLEVWMNAKEQTWTILKVDAHGCAAIVASGQGVSVGLVEVQGEDG